MFEMSANQQKAFTDGAGISALRFDHAILIVIGLVAVVWLALIFIGLMKNKERNVFEAMAEFVFAAAILIVIGSIIYYV